MEGPEVIDSCLRAGDPVPGVGAGTPAPEVEGAVGQAGVPTRQRGLASAGFLQHAAGALARSLHPQTVNVGDPGSGQDARGHGQNVLSAPPV